MEDSSETEIFSVTNFITMQPGIGLLILSLTIIGWEWDRSGQYLNMDIAVKLSDIHLLAQSRVWKGRIESYWTLRFDPIL